MDVIHQLSEGAIMYKLMCSEVYMKYVSINKYIA